MEAPSCGTDAPRPGAVDRGALCCVWLPQRPKDTQPLLHTQLDRNRSNSSFRNAGTQLDMSCFMFLGKYHTFVQQFVSCCACVSVIYLSVWMQWVAGMAGFLLPCSPLSLRKRLKPMHVWLGGSILTLSIAACISGINEKLFFVLWVQIFCISFD